MRRINVKFRVHHELVPPAGLSRRVTTNRHQGSNWCCGLQLFQCQRNPSALKRSQPTKAAHTNIVWKGILLIAENLIDVNTFRVLVWRKRNRLFYTKTCFTFPTIHQMAETERQPAARRRWKTKKKTLPGNVFSISRFQHTIRCAGLCLVANVLLRNTRKYR